MELAGNAFNGVVVSACLTAMMIASPWTQVFCEAESAAQGSLVGEEAESEVLHEDKVKTTGKRTGFKTSGLPKCGRGDA